VDKQQKLKIALPILFVVMAIIWGRIIFGSGSSKSDNKSGNTSKGAVKSMGSLNIAGLSKTGGQGKARSIYAKWGQNPFMLKRSPKALNIEGIMWDKKNPKVIINGDIFGIGETVESKTIVDIRPSSVIIKGNDGKESELKY